jgi:hypothetical protein
MSPVPNGLCLVLFGPLGRVRGEGEVGALERLSSVAWSEKVGNSSESGESVLLDKGCVSARVGGCIAGNDG